MSTVEQNFKELSIREENTKEFQDQAYRLLWQIRSCIRGKADFSGNLIDFFQTEVGAGKEFETKHLNFLLDEGLIEWREKYYFPTKKGEDFAFDNIKRFKNHLGE